MNAISKKLLSMLVVVAMVLSMVPTVGIPAFAAEATEAEVAETVTPGQANLPEGVQEIIDEAAKVVNTDEAFEAHRTAGTCPMCGATGITWEHKTVGTTLAGTQDQAVHVYYDSALSISGNVLAMYTANSVTSQNNTLCVALKSTAVITNTGTRFLMASGAGNVFNIMGSGSVTTAVGTGTDYGMFQLGGGTVNLYGGTYVLDDADGTYAAVRANGGNLNIFNDATIGPETVDTTKPLYNVTFSSASSVVNMYGGTIRNGVTAKNGLSGNVTVAAGGTFNMYGGTISGGQYLAGTDADGNTISSPASVGGNVIVGGLQEGKTVSNAGKFYMYGGTITGGKAYNAGNGGGNINCYNTGDDNVMELMGGVITDGYAKAAGGNVQIQGGKSHKIGGTVLITNGSAASGGNVQVAASHKLTMEGGYIQGGTLATSSKNATNGGAVYVAGTFDMTGGEIDGCTASGNGGNIYAAGGATVNVGANATIKNGLSKSAANGGGGGNVYLAASTTAGSTMTTSGIITGGTVDGGESMASAGGNIAVVASGANQSVLTVDGGEISNGTLAYATAGSSFGGNIRAYNCKVVINDGLIYGGDAGDKSTSSIGVLGDASSSANVGSTLEINGGIIVGDIQGSYVASGKTSGDYTYTASVKLTGTPKIVNSYELADGTTVRATANTGLNVGLELLDISSLEAGAQIEVTASIGKVLTKATENAAAVASCFSCTASDRIVELQEDNTLMVVEKPAQEPTEDVFEPWNCDGVAYCPACEEFVTWTEYLGENDADGALTSTDSNAHFHLYLAEDATYDTQFLVGYRDVCFNLNGCDITAVDDGTYAFHITKTLNLLDTAGGAVVTGNGTSSTGSALHINGGNASATYNIYGGTYTKLATNTVASVVTIHQNGGTVNMYGGVIDATGTPATSGTTGGAVSIVGKAGGSNPATFILHDGEIKGGSAVYGGNVALTTAAATFTMKGGKVSGGTASMCGGNIRATANATINIEGGIVTGGHVSQNTEGTHWGGNVAAWNSTINISGGTIYGGTGGKNLSGANISCYCDATGKSAGFGVLTISGGTIVGDTAITQTHGTLVLSGAPVIVASTVIDGETVSALYGGLSMSSTMKADISELSADAQIAYTASIGQTITLADENAANVVGCFTNTASGRVAQLQADNTLKVVELAPEVGVFEPWNYNGKAYCPVCGDEEAVEWTELDSTHAAGYIDGHYYLTEDITEASKGDKSAYIMPTSGKIACVNLNGHDLTVTDGCALFGANGTLNMIDTAEEQGTVSGGNTTSSGATIQLNGGKGSSKVNLYGGIYTKIADTSNAPIVSINANGGTLSMYGGVIDGTGKTTNSVATCVYLQGSVGGQYSAQAIFNMHGGKILGGTSTGNGGAIMVGSIYADTTSTSYNNAAVFNLYDGEVIGGTANGSTGGGCIYVLGNTFNMYGGTVKDGTAKAHGGNIYLNYKATMNSDGTAGANNPATMTMSGGTISGGSAATEGTSNGGTMVVNTGCSLDMTGGTIYGGTAGNQGGILRAYKATVNMSGDAVMYAGTANGTAKTHGVWLVASDMTMSDNAAVYGPTGATTHANAISVGHYERASSLTLSGNATVKAAEGDSKNCIQITHDATGTYNNVLMVSNDWTGEAYVIAYKEDYAGYHRGETIYNANAVCGSIVDGAITKGGSFTGKLYYGPQSNAQILGVEGDMVIGLVVIKAADGDTWYITNEEAFEDYYANGGFEAGSYVMVGNDAEITLAGDAYVDGRGYNVTVDGVGTLYAMDNANDDYVGFGTWTIISADVEVATDVENVVKDRRYIVIDITPDDENNRRVTAHRLEMGLSAVSLRASQAGLYYKASYSCDTTLASRISAYGVVLSVKDMPGADFLDDPTDGFSCYETGFDVNADNGYTVNATSGAVFGIFKSENRTADQNAEYGKMKIYANTYIMVNTQNDANANNDVALVGDNANAGTQGGAAYSLFDILKHIDTNWADYVDAQAQVTEFYNTWAELGMNQYADEFENIA